MNKYDFSQLVNGQKVSDPLLFHRVSARLADKDPELQSLLWLLREGVIGRGHFQSMVADSFRD